MTFEEECEQIYDRIWQGKAAEMSIIVHRSPNRIVFVPAYLYSTERPNELMIACEGRGVYFYDGQAPIDEFILVARGFPFDLAKAIKEIVGEIMKQSRDIRQQPLLLEQTK